MHRERLAAWDTELQEHWPPPRPQPEQGGLADGKDTLGPADLGASLPGSREERSERETSEEKKGKQCANARFRKLPWLKQGNGEEQKASSPGISLQELAALLLLQWKAQSLGRKLPDT